MVVDKFEIDIAFSILCKNFKNLKRAISGDSDSKKAFIGIITYCYKNCSELRDEEILSPKVFCDIDDCTKKRYIDVLKRIYTNNLYIDFDKIEMDDELMDVLNKLRIKGNLMSFLRTLIKCAQFVACFLAIYSVCFYFGYRSQNDKNDFNNKIAEIVVTSVYAKFDGCYYLATYDRTLDKLDIIEHSPGYLNYSIPGTIIASMSKVNTQLLFKEYGFSSNKKFKNSMSMLQNLLDLISKQQGKYKVIVPLSLFFGYLGYNQGMTYSMNKYCYERETHLINHYQNKSAWKDYISQYEQRLKTSSFPFPYRKKVLQTDTIQ